MRDLKQHSRAYLGRYVLAMITILAIAGTLSACGRYGGPVRVTPVEVGTIAPEGGVEADTKAGSTTTAAAADPKSMNPAAGEESDREDEDDWAE